MGTPDDMKVFAKTPHWNPMFPRHKAKDMSAIYGPRLGKEGVDLLEGLLKMDAKQRTTTPHLTRYAYLNDDHSTKNDATR
jgi:hypothetical protein